MNVRRKGLPFWESSEQVLIRLSATDQAEGTGKAEGVVRGALDSLVNDIDVIAERLGFGEGLSFSSPPGVREDGSFVLSARDATAFLLYGAHDFAQDALNGLPPVLRTPVLAH